MLISTPLPVQTGNGLARAGMGPRYDATRSARPHKGFARPTLAAAPMGVMARSRNNMRSGTEESGSGKWDAFVSYSHAADGKLAPALQHGLQQMAKPWYRRRALRVFRDATGLSVDPTLWRSIQSALDGSRFFILLASPQAARSPWVEREVEYWKLTKPVDRILPVLTEGGWAWDAAKGDLDWASSTAAPPALRDVFSEEPRHLDLRWARAETHLDLRDGRFRDAIAELAAPIRGCSKDELVGQDIQQHRRTLRLAWSTVSILVLFLVIAVTAAVVAVANADRADHDARQSLSRALGADATSLLGRNLGLSVLLALAADLVAPTVDARSAMVQVLSQAGPETSFLPGQASDVAFSPDGGLLAVTGSRGAQLWRLPEWRRQGAPLGHGPTYRLAFSPDGRLLAVGPSAARARRPQRLLLVRRTPAGGDHRRADVHLGPVHGSRRRTTAARGHLPCGQPGPAASCCRRRARRPALGPTAAPPGGPSPRHPSPRRPDCVQPGR